MNTESNGAGGWLAQGPMNWPVEWLVGGAALLVLMGLILGAVLLVRGLRRSLRALHSDIAALRGERETIDRELAKLRRAALELGKGHRVLGRRIDMTRRQQQELEFRDIGNVTYAHAGRMVEMGAGSEELVASCGISAAEARLISMMYQHRPGQQLV